MKESKSKPLVVLVVVFLVVSLVSPTVAAQGGAAQSLLLDTERQQLGRVAVDGSSYTVYSYDNVLPYADGIEVYHNGERVTSEAEARKAVRVIAWQRAATQLKPRDIEALRKIDESAARINRIVSLPLSVLNQALGLIDNLKEQRVAGTSAWDLVTGASPSLKQFESAARELQRELQEWKSAADGVNNNAPLVIEDLERMERGQNIDYSRLSRRFAATMGAIDQLQRKSIELRDGLSTASRTSSTVSDDVQSVPFIGGDLSRFFLDVSGELGNAARDVDTYSDALRQQHSKMSRVKSVADREQTSLMNSWRARQTAEVKVYGTVGAGGFAGLLIVFSLIRRF